MKMARFTLVEIMVVTAVIGVVAGLSLGSLSDAKSRGKFARWLGYKTNLIAEPSMLVYYDFQESGSGKVKNQAFGINVDQYDQRRVDASINNANWVRGRWRNKGGLWMDGVSSYAGIGSGNKINSIPKEFSVEFWFLPITLGRGILIQSDASISDESTTVQDVKDAAGFSPGNSGNGRGNGGNGNGGNGNGNGCNKNDDDTITEAFVLAVNNKVLELSYIADISYEAKKNTPNGRGNCYAWGTKVVKLDVDRQDLTFNCNFTPGRWYHVIVTYSYDQQRVKLYLNGNLKQEYVETRPVLYLFGETWIGGNSQTGNSFNGIIDEFALYGRALTSAEVKGHYEMGAP